MEKDIALGAYLDLELAIHSGVASLGLKTTTAGPISANLAVSLDAEALVDKLFAAIEAALPAGAVPIEESVKLLVKNAVKAA